MPAALLPPKGWAEVRAASEAGVDDETLAKRYEVPRGAIRLRRMREKWLTPQRVEEERLVAEAKAVARTVTGDAMKRMERTSDGKEGLTVVAETLMTYAEEGSLHFAKLAHNALKRKKSLTIRTVSDAVAAAKGLRLVAGMDKETPVTINMGAWSASAAREIGGDLYDA